MLKEAARVNMYKLKVKNFLKQAFNLNALKRKNKVLP
jgi:hypothetical protein